MPAAFRDVRNADGGRGARLRSTYGTPRTAAATGSDRPVGYAGRAVGSGPFDNFEEG
ncbi:hypothetical protein GCM10023405_30160 [Streptomonospora salina]